MAQDSAAELVAFYRVMAPYYDGDHRDFYEGRDIAVYVEWAREAPGPVLDMGCGTGRATLPLARAGCDVCAMDNSPAMLEQLQVLLDGEPEAVRSRVRLLEGDIRSASPDRQYGMILAAGHVLHSFLTRADQRAWLRNVRGCLAPGGSFVFDTFQFDFSRLFLPLDDWAMDVDRIDEATGDRIQRFVHTEYQPVEQLMSVSYRWKVTGAREREEEATAWQRWFTRAELENLLELEGFQVAEYRGSYSGGEPFGPDGLQFFQIVRAVQAS